MICLLSFLMTVWCDIPNFVTGVTGSGFNSVGSRTTVALRHIVALWQLRSQGRSLVVCDKVNVLLLEPCDQQNRVKLAVG
jgi:hypothetical protein